MRKTFHFLKKVMDSLFEHIVVLDKNGEIVFTNKAWDDFAKENNYLVEGDWLGLNYLKICDEAAQAGDEYGEKASVGIKDMQNGLTSFSFEYPCRNANKKNWFKFSANSIEIEKNKFFVISNSDITERKFLEAQTLNLSQVDSLTKLFNRQYFDELLAEEWKRSARLVLPITLAIIDIDHLKMLNDNYGYQYGDECLVKIGSLIKEFANRPGDIVARYGGDEIVLMFGSSTSEVIWPKLSEFMDKIRALKIPNQKSPVSSFVTVSIGIATSYPSRFLKTEHLLKDAGMYLYKAKKNGRDRIEY